MFTVPLGVRMSAYLVVVLVLGVLVASGSQASQEITHALLTGWLDFIAKVLPAAEVYWPSIITAAVAAVVVLVGLHFLASWITRPPADAPAIAGRGWKLRWTVAIVGLVVLLFVAGIVMVAILHQLTWLTNDFGSDRAFGSRVGSGRRR